VNRYKIIVAYDGTDYAGWARQEHMVGIVNVLQQTFEKGFKAPISVRGASRTDASVHALGQVATFLTDLAVQPERMIRAWNNLLPSAIMIRSLEPVPYEYNVHAKVAEKTYWYHISEKRPVPMVGRFVWQVPRPIDYTLLNEALQVFVGTHDFRSFSTGYDRETTIRTINSITLEPLTRFGVMRIVVKGPTFLHHMVRRMVGAAVDVASRDELSVDTIVQALAAKNPQQMLPNAPGHGLVLYHITYEDADETLSL
jgi:tRNA pseudouridine38-40 synthase